MQSVKLLALLLCKEQSNLEVEEEASLEKSGGYTAMLDSTQVLPCLCAPSKSFRAYDSINSRFASLFRQ